MIVTTQENPATKFLLQNYNGEGSCNLLPSSQVDINTHLRRHLNYAAMPTSLTILYLSMNKKTVSKTAAKDSVTANEEITLV